MNDNGIENDIIKADEPTAASGAPETEGQTEQTEHTETINGGKKPSRWSYERHIVQCPVCGKDILDHMTVCPHCKSEIVIGGVKPMSEDTLRRVKIIALIAGIAIALVIIIPILMKKFGG